MSSRTALRIAPWLQCRVDALRALRAVKQTTLGETYDLDVAVECIAIQMREAGVPQLAIDAWRDGTESATLSGEDARSPDA